MKGRPRDPKRAKRATGHRPTPGAPIAVGRGLKAIAPAGPPEPPEDLDERAAGVWRAVIGEVDPFLLRGGGWMLLKELCRAYAFAEDAGREISRLGQIVKGERGPMVNPLFKVWRDAGSSAVRYAEQLGLTPASHVRLGLQVLTGRSMHAQLEADLGSRS